ncbi:MAG: Tyrosine-tRNA ligase [candidate division WWE3 bacterium GW2011_GWF2_41_45]|uniref:Tyrosine--tRNA ligase n=3 Tax=Katanobacteria TaxID=422282 RepID=A0A1F4W297_UNCKA|nr:MAG: Tyrosine-tRNA ligase [candidate division WWE3 bacterium GW2011_GWC2_41_23]KKS10549.1 MAG: Tyrosine-tRNA ligase [candidate division WWE3 bacterium GW2011_GWF2_41_45]KKS20256.1 MAG: Tyrosine-tRNA ligase [candidate division WWE3 bacterium GW2011_GWE1_41_72]KKS28220.1 MAG: Tyrosine-tRNA ligase [candidate division WWE3 bacterium GW2011_GWD2_42_11]KKS28259.1 MAG: Tyrosine-tRNA ligase [candidate division WWE3 bacterium GW2011_GWC1_42_102]KKS51012.1 MAG: Tyrosine-tRNA ligase [candidate divisio
MAKVSTDEKLINTFLERGVDSIFPTKDALKKKLMSGERIKAYQGFDPTGPYLHVGHAMGIRALRILQQLGHEAIFLVGDFTTLIGDPDKDTARPLMTEEQIQKNMAGWKEQAAQLIDFEGDNPVKFMRNHEWLSKISLADLIKLLSNATVQQMIERDYFAKRLKRNNPIGLQEFIYPLMQGFDSVAMGVDLEIGGTDQTFNMLMGRELVKRYLGKDKFVRTNEMMEAPDALTMSKTGGNGINLADKPEEMYGKAMSYPDELVTKCLRLLTDMPMEEIWEINQKMQDGENPMTFKKLMAFEVVKIIKGAEKAGMAQKHFERTVQKKDISDEDTEMVEFMGTVPVTEFLKKALKNSESASHIKRIVEQGGVEINGKKVVSVQAGIEFTPGTVVKFGKRKYFKVVDKK